MGIATAPNGTTYVANIEDGTVSVLNASATVAQTISTGGAPYGVTTSTDGSSVFVVNKTAKLVSVISAATNTISSTIPVPGTPSSFGVFFSSAAAPQSVLAAAILPISRSVVVGSTATYLSTVLNTGAATVSGCQFALPSSAPSGLSLTYQPISSSAQVTGSANQPIAIGPNQGQGFLLALTSAAVVAAEQQPLVISCAGTAPAPEVVGLDVPGIAFSTTAAPDVVVLSATTSNNGIVATPVGTAAAFAAATDNVGAAGSLTATVDTQGLALPVTLTVCQTNPGTGACLATPTASLSVTFAAGATPTFSVFLLPTGTIPFAPSAYRVFLRFIDTNGVSHGSTSVAVQTL
jgi:YVTN family beta-propeller protein